MSVEQGISVDIMVEAGISTMAVAAQDDFIVVNEENCKSVQVNMKIDHQLMKRNFGTQTDKIGVCDSSSQTEISYCNENCDSDDDISSSQETHYPPVSEESVSPQKSYIPRLEEETSETDDCETTVTKETDTSKPQDDKQFLVFESELCKLWKRCVMCGATIVEAAKSTQASLLFVELTCINHHTFPWQSQPLIHRMASGNLLLSSAILLSGATYTKVSAIAEIMNLQFFSEKNIL